jgi:hypothetical protein
MPPNSRAPQGVKGRGEMSPNAIVVLLLVGRILYGGFFLMSGINHFVKMNSYKPYVASKGVADPMAKMNEQINFMKNVALLGAALAMAAIPQPWPISLGR